MFQQNESGLPFDLNEAKKLLATDAGKQLLQLLSRDGGAALQQAAAHLKDGEVERAKQAMAATMSAPEAQKLVAELNRQTNR